MDKARCPHCGLVDAPVDQGCIDRHRRADWDRDASPSNEVCAGGGLWLRVGEGCGHRHLGPNPDCLDQQTTAKAAR